MDILISSRNLELNDGTQDYIRKRLTPLGRRLRSLSEAKVEVRHEPTRSVLHRVVVQVTLNANGALLRAEERGSNVNEVMDVVAEALDHQVVRFKGQRYRSLRARKSRTVAAARSASEADEGQAVPDDAPEVEGGRLVRVKRFAMKPVPLEEAAAQMELLGHSFFFFINAATNQYNVLYRRGDGDYGVIEPA